MWYGTEVCLPRPAFRVWCSIPTSPLHQTPKINNQCTFFVILLLFLSYDGSVLRPVMTRNGIMRVCMFRASSRQLQVAVTNSFIVGCRDNPTPPPPMSTTLAEDRDMHVHHLSSTIESTLASLPYDNLHFHSCVGGAFDDNCWIRSTNGCPLSVWNLHVRINLRNATKKLHAINHVKLREFFPRELWENHENIFVWN